MSNPATTPPSSASAQGLRVRGNAPDELKRMLATKDPFRTFTPAEKQLDGFAWGEQVVQRLELAELSVSNNADEPKAMEAKAVLEVEVTKDMLNQIGILHGGCSATLVDMASAYALFALRYHRAGHLYAGVSHSLNLVFHSSAKLGDRLRLVNTTIAFGGRVETVRTEIWNVTSGRLVASGVHIQMTSNATKVEMKAAL